METCRYVNDVDNMREAGQWGDASHQALNRPIVGVAISP